MMKSNHKNTETLRYLKAQGYDGRAIRAALLKLAGYEHHELAEELGKHRTEITNTLNMVKYRTKTRPEIAGILGVPVEEFFDEPTTET